MAKRNRETNEDGLTARFRHIHETLYGGNQSQMAEALGISQSVISKILRGGQRPGPKILAGLRDHPQINPTWLYSGEGEPLLAEKGELQKGFLLPISEKPLSAPPGIGESPGGGMFPVAGAFFERDRYWLEVQPADHITRWREYGIKAGDLLLMKPHRPEQSEPQSLDRHLAVVRVGESPAELLLGELTYYSATEDEPKSLNVELFDSGVAPGETDMELVIRVQADLTLRSARVARHKSDTVDEPAKMVRNAQATRRDRTIDISDVVSICVLSLRTF